MLVKKINLILLLISIDPSCSHYYIHSTDQHRNPLAYDCLSFLNTLITPTIEEYCRRAEKNQLMISSDEKDQSCFDGVLISFEQLQAQHVSISDLLGWFITSRNQSHVTDGTCYTGLLECNKNRIICLHWHQICDGQVDCFDGIDEQNCTTLELNECDPVTEFRCRDGTCIPYLMAFDKFIDCLDASDEFHYAEKNGQLRETISAVDRFRDYDYRCSSGHWFSCNGIEAICTSTLWTKSSCASKNDRRFIQVLLGPPHNDTNDFCWLYTVCQLGFQHFFTEDIQITDAQCQAATTMCLTLIEEFVFPVVNEHFIGHPSVKFMYHVKNHFNESITPNFICYDSKKCDHIFIPTINKFKYSCNSWSEIMGNQTYRREEWNQLIYSVRQIFSSCYLSVKDLSNMSSHLFNCDNRSIFISKHRVHDSYIDCYNVQDELAELDSCALQLSHRFQCRTTTRRCIPRVFLLSKMNYCPNDTSTTDILFPCITQFDYGCKVIRGSLITVVYFSFFRVCDGSVDFIDRNHTDETNCPHDWIYDCNSSRTRCDGYWQCQNGRDELNCDAESYIWPVFESCMIQQQFYCVNITSRQLECYGNELAGNGQEDCVGGVDEKIGGFCQKTYPIEKTRRFHCSNSNRCLTVQQLCDGVNDCDDGINDDEQGLCPWLADVPFSSNLQDRRFICKSGASIDINERCNKRWNCDDAEDELFCDLEQGKISTSFEFLWLSALSDIVVYPPLSSRSITVTTRALRKVDVHEHNLSEETKLVAAPIRAE
ncbi:unnamed protein product [Adineta steineri]|uniref:Uncharacterized protein n=1 Tax=Adineta steineri TaxID=433720 RepID=A0A818WLT2_9BILA|nr:unnamed protein product [Adineta steineri]